MSWNIDNSAVLAEGQRVLISEDSLGRIANQAFFELIHIYEVEHTDTAEHGELFDLLFEPALHVEALIQDARAWNDRTPDHRVRGSSKRIVVELTGFEPVTPTLPVWCATSCAIAPW